RDRLAALVAPREVVALEHPGHRVLRRELDDPGGTERDRPAGIEVDPGAGGVQDLVDLMLVSTGVGLDLLARQPRSGGVLAARIADHPGEIADQEHDLVAEHLKLPHLVDEYRVAEVEIRRGRIEPRLDRQRLTPRELALEVRLEKDLLRPALELDQLFSRTQHP